MSDPVSVVQGLSAILSIAGQLADIAKRVKDAETKTKIIELQQKILDFQGEMSRLLEENETLRKEKRERENLDALAADLEFRPEDGFYVRKSEKSPKLIPYCPLCWDKERKLVHLTEGASRGVYACPSDGSCYWTAEFRNRSSGPRRGVPLGRA